jgi:DNA-binding MarR family transcriptional regulator
LDNVVDETVNQVVDSGNEVGPENRPGFELPLLLLAGFRAIVEALHAELARQGHPDARPAHGLTLQAIGQDGVTASELGRRLGVSKQAAGKTVDRLEKLGYVTRAGDERDARRKLIRLTRHGHDVLARSAAIFDDLRAQWVRTLGADRVRDLEDALRTVTPAGIWRLDTAAWFGA